MNKLLLIKELIQLLNKYIKTLSIPKNNANSLLKTSFLILEYVYKIIPEEGNRMPVYGITDVLHSDIGKMLTSTAEYRLDYSTAINIGGQLKVPLVMLNNIKQLWQETGSYSERSLPFSSWNYVELLTQWVLLVWNNLYLSGSYLKGLGLVNKKYIKLFKEVLQKDVVEEEVIEEKVVNVKPKKEIKPKKRRGRPRKIKENK